VHKGIIIKADTVYWLKSYQSQYGGYTYMEYQDYINMGLADSAPLKYGVRCTARHRPDLACTLPLHSGFPG